MPECGYCKDCRHWTDESPTVYKDPDPEPDEIDTRMFCALAENDGGDPNGSLAYGVDFGAARTALVTEPLFGCVQFQPKET